MALKILLADDSMNPQNMGKKILSDAGYEVVVVSNGAAAMKKLAEVKPDIAVLDVFMPGYTGVEICEKIRSNEDRTTAAMPVLLTIGKMEMGGYNVADGNKVKADGLVIKPFEASDLLAAVQKLAAKLKPPVPAPSASSRYEKTVIMQRPAVLEEFKDESYAQWKTEAAEPLPAAPAPAFAASAMTEEILAAPTASGTYEDTIRVDPPAGTRESASEIDLDAMGQPQHSSREGDFQAAAAAASPRMGTPTIIVPPQAAAHAEFGMDAPAAAPAYDFGSAPTVPAMDLGSMPPVVEASSASAAPAVDPSTSPSQAYDVAAPEAEISEASPAAFDPFATSSAPAADPFATMISAPAESVAAPESAMYAEPPAPAVDPFASSSPAASAGDPFEMSLPSAASSDPFAMPSPPEAHDPFAAAPAVADASEAFAAAPAIAEPPSYQEAPAVESFVSESHPVEVTQAPDFESHAAAPVEPVVTPESGLEPTLHAATPDQVVAPDPAFISDPHQAAHEFSTHFGLTETEPSPAPEFAAEPTPAASYEAAPAEVEHPSAAMEEPGFTDEHASFEAGISAPPVEMAPPEPAFEPAVVAEPEAVAAPERDPEEDSRLLAIEMQAAVELMPVVGSDVPAEVQAAPAPEPAAPVDAVTAAAVTHQVESEVARGIAEAIGAQAVGKSPNDREVMVRVVRRILDQELPTLLYQIMTEYDRERS